MKDISIVLKIPGGEELRWIKKRNIVYSTITTAIYRSITARTAKIVHSSIDFSIEEHSHLFACNFFSTFLIVEFWETDFDLENEDALWKAIDKYSAFGPFPQLLKLCGNYQILRLDYFDAVY